MRTLSGPAIAAVIPTYQREATIGRAIESVLAQTVAPVEVIVVDDGSTDGTHERIRAFGASVRVIAQLQSGSAAARNRGVEAASADWIAFLDSDDRWEFDHLERVSEAIVATSGRADFYFRDTDVAFEAFDADRAAVRVGSLWALAEFAPKDPVTLVQDASSWVLLPTQPMMVQASVVRRARYVEVGGMWSRLKLRHDTHLFFKLGLGAPMCAVEGVGVTMTDDAADDRLTRGVSPLERSYWDETVLMYENLARTTNQGTVARREFEQRLAAAHWRTSRIAMAQRSPRSALASLLGSFRAQPLFIPRTLVRRVTRPHS